MGVIGSTKVVTGSERRRRPDLIQPGDREWATVIEAICADGSAIPPYRRAHPLVQPSGSCNGNLRTTDHPKMKLQSSI